MVQHGNLSTRRSGNCRWRPLPEYLGGSIIGGAVLSSVMGWISEALWNVAFAYALHLISYIYIGLYAFVGAAAAAAGAQFSQMEPARLYGRVFEWPAFILLVEGAAIAPLQRAGLA